MGRFRLFSAANPDVDANSFWRSTSILPKPGVSLNFPRFVDDKIDDAIKTATGSTDPKVRDQAYQTINREFAANLPYIWLGRAVVGARRLAPRQRHLPRRQRHHRDHRPQDLAHRRLDQQVADGPRPAGGRAQGR